MRNLRKSEMHAGHTGHNRRTGHAAHTGHTEYAGHTGHTEQTGHTGHAAHTGRTGHAARVVRTLKTGIALTLILAVSLALLPLAASAETGAEDAAVKLNTLGLFLGIGVSDDGTPDFALDRVSTRAEAVTMLVRLFGMEAEALRRSWTIPFEDVPAWARPYVGYAYANGLTYGISNTNFGSGRAVTATEFITLVLRALGYTSGVDFEWDSAWVLSDTLGFTDERYDGSAATFLRGDIAMISYNALSITHKDTGKTLCSSLIEAGVFTEAAAREAGLGAAISGSISKQASVNTATPGALEFERAIFILINIERERQGLDPLLWDTRVAEVARAHSIDMNQRNFFNHVNPDGDGLGARISAGGIVYRYCGENLARGQRTPEAVVAAWMESSGHRRTIMSDRATHLGVGFHNYYWTADMIG